MISQFFQQPNMFVFAAVGGCLRLWCARHEEHSNSLREREPQSERACGEPPDNNHHCPARFPHRLLGIPCQCY